MHSEKRKEVRSAYPIPRGGKLQVLFDDKSILVTSVKDVSSTGIRLEIESPISVGENIMIRYLAETMDIKLNGTVVWNSIAAGNPADTAEPLPILIGVKLLSPSLLQALW